MRGVGDEVLGLRGGIGGIILFPLAKVLCIHEQEVCQEVGGCVGWLVVVMRASAVISEIA